MLYRQPLHPPAAFTHAVSVRLLDFGLSGSLIHGIRLICGFCSSGQGFASGFLQTPPRGGRPCLWLCASRHRARSGSSPVRSRPCRAHQKSGPADRCTYRPDRFKLRITITFQLLQPFSCPLCRCKSEYNVNYILNSMPRLQER